MAKQPPKTSRSWGKNIAVSIAHVTKDVVAEVMPNTMGSMSSATSSGRDMLSSLSKSSQSMARQISVMDRSAPSRKAKGIFKSAMNDIREGNIYYKDTSNELSYLADSFDMDDLETPTDSKDDFSAAYSATDSVKAIAGLNTTMANTASATITGIGRMSDIIATTQLKSSEAMSATIKNVSVAQTNVLSEGLNQIAKQIQISNQYSAAMLEFMNKNISPTNQSMLDVMPLIGQKLDQIANSLSGSGSGADRGYHSANDPMNNILMDGTGLNIKGMMKHFKSNFENSGVGALFAMASMATGIGSGMGLGGIAKTTAKSAMPMLTKNLTKMLFGDDNLKRISRLDETVHDAVKEALYSLGDLKDPMIRAKNGTNRLMGFLSDIFGVERPKMTKLNLGGGRRDENMQWNAIAQKTLVDVIPGLLSSIDKSLSGAQYGKHYDYRTGKFMTEDEIGKRYAQETRELMDKSFNDATSKILDSLVGTGIRFNEKDIDKILNSINLQVDKRLNGEEGNTKAYKSEIQNILKANGLLSESKISDILMSLEKGIRSVTDTMSKFNHDINMGNHDYQAYRSLMGGSNQFGAGFANHAMSRSYSALNRGSYAPLMNDIPPSLADQVTGIVSGFLSNSRKAGKPRGVYAPLGAIADVATSSAQHYYVGTGTNPEKLEAYRTNSAKTSMKAADRAEAINKKKERFSKLRKRNYDDFRIGSTDSQVLAENIAIEEAYLYGEPQDIMQGLAQDIHSKLLVPMYGTFFSKKGILNKFFGDDPNSEFNKLKEKLFGDEGIFRPMADWLKYKFTGKGYTARDGRVFEDTDDNVFNKLKGTYGRVYDNTMIYLLGEDYKDQEIYKNMLHGLSPEGIAQWRAHRRAKKEVIKRDAEEWANQKESEKLSQSIGNGYRNRSFVGYGFSQYDPRWSGRPTGRFGDGRIATMATAGCGPVALANVANYLGYGLDRVDPMDTLGVAKKYGYLSNGGATEELFTRGASKIGLKGKAVSFINAMRALKKRMPVIFAGKSRKKGSIYSNEGHIVTAYRTGEGGVLVNDGDEEYFVPPETLLDGMTHAFTFTNRRGKSIGGALDNDDIARRFLRDEAKYSEETINAVDYLRAMDIENISYDELEKRLKKARRKTSDHKTSGPKNHVYDGVLLDIKHVLEKIFLATDTIVMGHKDTPGYLNSIKQILDKKVPDMNQVFAGISTTINSGMDNLRWALDGSANEQRSTMLQIQDIIKKITDDKADLSDANVRAAINSDIKDLTATLTTFMQGMPQHTSYLQQSDYAEAQQIIGSLTSQLADVSNNIGNITKPENLKQIISTINEMNEKQLQAAMSTVLDPTKMAMDAAAIFRAIEGETANKSTFNQEERAAQLAETFADLIEPEINKDGDKLTEEVKESAEKVVESVKKQADITEKSTEVLEDSAAIIEDLTDDPKTFRTKFSDGYEKAKKKLFKDSTKHLHAGVIGASIGMLNGIGGGSFLTNLFLPGGPVGGAVMGLAASIIGHSKTFNNIMYGKEDENGERHGGITTQKAMNDLKAKFKKVMPYAVGGATLGVLKNVVGSMFGLSLGGAPGIIGGALLGSGPIGAAIVGMGVGLLKNNERFKEILFGKKADDDRHYGGKFSGALNKMTDVVKASSSYLKSGFKGAGFGALTGAMLGSMGYLPAALAVGGPVGMAITGLAVGIASNTDRFKRYLFGTEDVDDEGNKTKNKDGLFHRMGQQIMQDAIYPIKDMMYDKVTDFAIWARENVELPFKIAFGPIVDKFKDIREDIHEIVGDAFDKVSKGVINIFKGGVEKALTPLTWGLRKGADLATSALSFEMKALAKIAMAPVNLIAGYNKKHGEYGRYDKAYRRGIQENLKTKWAADDEYYDGKLFGRVRRTGRHFLDSIGFGKFADPEREALAREALGKGAKFNHQNHFGWIEAESKVNLAKSKYVKDKERRTKFKKAAELARQWSREDSYNESRKWTKDLLDERYNALRTLGFDDRAIRSEAEIKKLMFHRGDWQNTWGKYGDEDLRVEEIKLQQETAEKTENYQSTMTDYMRAMLDIMMGKGYQAALDATAGKRIERDRARRDEFFHTVVKNGGDLSDYRDEFAMTREEYNAASRTYQKDLSDMSKLSYDERIQFCRSKGLPTYLANMVDDTVKTSSGSNVASFESFSKSMDTSSADVKKSAQKAIIYNMADEGLKSAAASALGIDLSDVVVKSNEASVQGTSSQTPISTLIRRMNANIFGKDDNIIFGDGENKGKVDVDKYIEVALLNGVIEQNQADALRGSFKNNVVSRTTLNSHLKTVLFESMDAALNKNLTAYDEEQDNEEIEKQKKQKEERETAEAQNLGEKKDDKNHSWLYNKLFYNADGEARGGIAGWAKKKADKISDNKFIKTLAAIVSSPMGKIGLGLGAYLFSDQLISFADKVSDVWQEHIPALWNFVSGTVVPAVLSKVGDIASWCVQALPGIFQGIGNGLWTLVKDAGKKLGLITRDQKHSASEVDLAAGTTLDGQTLVQYTDPVTGETSFVMDENGNYRTLGNYQYLTDDGYIEDIDKGVGGSLAQGLYRSFTSAKTAKAMLKTSGAAIRVGSAIGKHIPIVSGVFKATDAAGKGLMNIGNSIGNGSAKGGLTDWMMKANDRYAANVADYNKFADNVARKKQLKSNIKASKARRGTHKQLAEAVGDQTKYLDEAAQGTMKTLDKIFAKLGKSFNRFSKFIDKLSFKKWINYFKEKATGCVKKLKSSQIAKLSAKFGTAAGKVIDDFVPFLNVAMTAYDAISGWCNAEYLFDVPSGEEDACMRTVSSVMNTLLGLGVGPLIDILLVFVSDALGYDLKKDIAQKLYVFLMELTGNDAAIERFEENQKVLQYELAAYNAAHPTAELTLDEYQALKKENDSMLNKIANVFGGGKKEDFTKYEEASKQIHSDIKEFGVVRQSTLNTYQFIVTDPSAFGLDPNTLSSVGNGKGIVGYGYSQADPRWANYKLGTFANGRPATMDLAGCGPTALANVATQLTGSNVSPVQVATMAKRKGYLTHGGANEALFDNGTEAFGMSSRRIGNSEIISHLKNGEKVIVSGKSASVGYGKTPFTPSGHIITLEGMVGKNVLISDPQDGTTSIQSLSALTPELTHAWAFSNKGKNHVLGLGSGLVGYGDATLKTYVNGYRKKGYTADEIASYLRNYKADTDDDNYYLGDFHNMKDQSWYNEWSIDRSYNRYGPLDPNVAYYAFDPVMSYDKNKLTETGMYFNQITSDQLSKLETWFNSLDPFQKKENFAKWATDASFTLDSVATKDNGLWGIGGPAQYLADYYLFPKYGLENGFSSTDISNIQVMRGYSPKMTGYMYDPNTKLPVEIASSSSVNVTTYDPKKEIRDLNKSIKNHTAWNDMPFANGYNDIYSYYQMPIGTFMSLSDPAMGGDASIKQNWLYRYLWYLFKENLKTSTISENDVINKNLIDTKLSGQSINESIAMMGIDGVNIAANDYSVRSTRPYGIVNGIPFYTHKDERWSSYKWRDREFKESGSEIASLAMILSAYSNDGSSNRAITPGYIMNNWLNEEHSDWWNAKGLLGKFYSKAGMQTLKETFDETGSPLRIRQVSTIDGAMSAMKDNKLVLMNVPLANGYHPFYDSKNTTGESDEHFAVGTYANDDAFIVTDPLSGGKGSELLLPKSAMKYLCFKNGLVFSKGNDSGLGLVGERNYEEPEQSSSIWSQILESTKSEMASAFLQATQGVAAIFKNLGKYLMSGGKKKYESIFDETYDPTDTGMMSDEDIDSYDYLNSLQGVNLYNNATYNFKNSSGYKADTSMSKTTYTSKPTSTAKYSTPFTNAQAAIVNGGTKNYGKNVGNGIGGESDYISAINSAFGQTMNAFLGRNPDGTPMNGEYTDQDFDPTNEAASENYTDASGKLTALGLVLHARKMQKAGARYVWGGSCQKYTSSYKTQLANTFRDDDHPQSYYDQRFSYCANKIVTDCSGLIRGYTGKSYNAHGLYTSGTQKGTISSVPNKPGYLVFRKSTESDRMVHVGITTGGGKVIHCAGYEPNLSSDVKEESITKSKWTHWCKCHLLSYDIAPAQSVKSAAFDSTKSNAAMVAYGVGPDGNPVNYLTKTLGGRITQGVGYGIDPETGSLVRHRGTDIAASYGTPIHSPVSGRVVESKSAGYGSAYGNYAVIQDNRGAKHLFAHMDRPTGYGIGSTVHSGDVIGNVGNSGYSTGPHLHYEVRSNDHIIDPMNHRTNLNIVESRFDESMKKTSSPTGGENDIINLASSLGATANNTDEIVNMLRKIADLLTVWQGVDEESKASMIAAMEESTGTKIALTNLLNASNKPQNNSVSVNGGASSTEELISTGGRHLFDVLAKK